MTTFSEPPDGAGRRVALVASRFNEMVVAKLVDGATSAFASHGVADSDLDLVWVPGAFELPFVAERLAASGRYDAVVCVGTVIRGETSHYEVVANEAARGVREAAARTSVPVIFGVLTTETLEQALDRAGGAHGNKGWDAAEAGLEMAGLLEALEKGVT